ncbi:DUF1934 domain-containing protein [Cellulosilyticum ruminicola]|uniref:DUF1934 domain-containing protein n=1 Tax=Cellulosilyticum ruminicola TaxID=425254 RepID=UPI0006CF4132|nr:DUF1934 domain-containing protein [Cellulosilyticum ruminicola]
MKQVTVKVYDKQTYDTHFDTNEVSYKGQLAFKNDGIFITYKEAENNITTMIKAKDNKIAVKRYGGMKANLSFDKEMPHKTIYYTPYGEMEIQIKTHKCDTYILEKGIKIYIEYSIWMQDKKVSDNVYMLVAN